MKEQIKNWKNFFRKEDSSTPEAPSAVEYPRSGVDRQTSTQADGLGDKETDTVKYTSVPESREQIDRDYSFNPQMDKPEKPDLSKTKNLDKGRISTK